MTCHSFHSDVMTLGGMGGICEVILSVLSAGRMVPQWCSQVFGLGLVSNDSSDEAPGPPLGSYSAA